MKNSQIRRKASQDLWVEMIGVWWMALIESASFPLYSIRATVAELLVLKGFAEVASFGSFGHGDCRDREKLEGFIWILNKLFHYSLGLWSDVESEGGAPGEILMSSFSHSPPSLDLQLSFDTEAKWPLISEQLQSLPLILIVKASLPPIIIKTLKTAQALSFRDELLDFKQLFEAQKIPFMESPSQAKLLTFN